LIYWFFDALAQTELLVFDLVKDALDCIVVDGKKLTLVPH
jgi:hypothetical protein